MEEQEALRGAPRAAAGPGPSVRAGARGDPRPAGGRPPRRTGARRRGRWRRLGAIVAIVVLGLGVTDRYLRDATMDRLLDAVEPANQARTTMASRL